MRANSISDIFFDLDHTLWDFEHNSALAFDFIFKKHKINLELQKFLAVYSPINKELWKLYRNDKIEKDVLRHKRLADTFSALNMELSAVMLDTLSEDYIANLANYNKLFPDTIPVLDYLYANYNLHIITNGFAEVQQQKLKNSKIDRYFKTVTSSDEVGVKKPHPAIFSEALKRAQTKKENSFMIGDNLEADVIGAEQCGWTSVFFDPADKQGFDGKKINSLHELKGFF